MVGNDTIDAVRKAHRILRGLLVGHGRRQQHGPRVAREPQRRPRQLQPQERQLRCVASAGWTMIL